MNIELKLAEIEVKLQVVDKEICELELNDPTNNWDEHCIYMKSTWDKQAKLNREKRMLMIPEFTDRDFDADDDVMSLKNFIENVNDGGFIDYDGFGRYIRGNQESNIDIYPSDIRHDAIRDDFDTIIWFNR